MCMAHKEKQGGVHCHGNPDKYKNASKHHSLSFILNLLLSNSSGAENSKNTNKGKQEESNGAGPLFPLPALDTLCCFLPILLQSLSPQQVDMAQSERRAQCTERHQALAPSQGERAEEADSYRAEEALCSVTKGRSLGCLYAVVRE